MKLLLNICSGHGLNVELIYILEDAAKPSIYLIWAYFLKAIASSLFGWYFLHIVTASVFIEVRFIWGNIGTSTLQNVAVE